MCCCNLSNYTSCLSTLVYFTQSSFGLGCAALITALFKSLDRSWNKPDAPDAHWHTCVSFVVKKLTYIVNWVCCQTVGIHLLNKTVGVGKENFRNYCLGSRYWTFEWLYWYVPLLLLQYCCCCCCCYLHTCDVPQVASFCSLTAAFQ